MTRHTTGYSGTPLAKKLGVKPGATVVLLGAPDDFEGTLGELPEGVRLRRDRRARPDLVVWFLRSARELERDVAKITGWAVPAGLWIAWPKGSSPLAADFNREDVRDAGLAAGWVDHKVCAIDDDFSALRFAPRQR